MKLEEILRRMRKSKFFMAGFIMVFIIIAISQLSPHIIVHNPIKTDLKFRLIPPEYFAKGWSGNILGTDALGQDVLTRLLMGSRVSLLIALVGVTIPCIIGTALGVIAGYYGGFIDSVIMRLNDIQLSIPTMVLAITVMAIFGNSVSNLMMVLIIVGWVSYARVVRGTVMGIRTGEFVQASRALGASNIRIMITQILPYIMAQLIVLMSQQVGTVILTEANLSFLGMGVPLPQPSWGTMIAAGREYITTAPWTVIAPGFALMITVLAFNFLGDGIRDVFDPKNKD